MLNLTTRKNFNLFKDPFTDDVMVAGDVFLNDNSRFAEEYLYITAKIGGMLALLGESGSGKTTIRRLAIFIMRAGTTRPR
jgi:type II secretory pathway predicted ATPase ExeA